MNDNYFDLLNEDLLRELLKYINDDSSIIIVNKYFNNFINMYWKTQLHIKYNNLKFCNNFNKYSSIYKFLDKHGLFYAFNHLKEKDIDIAKVILSNNFTREHLNNLLVKSIWNNQLSLVKLLINHGANLIGPCDCLSEAVKRSNLKMVKYISSFNTALLYFDPTRATNMQSKEHSWKYAACGGFIANTGALVEAIMLDPVKDIEALEKVDYLLSFYECFPILSRGNWLLSLCKNNIMKSHLLSYKNITYNDKI